MAEVGQLCHVSAMCEPASEDNLAENSSKDEESTSTEKSVLSPEEQMAQFEDALKEEDWGHQPC